MKFLNFILFFYLFFMSSLAYANDTLNLEIENQSYTEKTKLCGIITYQKLPKNEEYEFEALVPPRILQNSARVTVQVPNKRFHSVSLILFREDAPKDATAYAMGKYNFPSWHISKFEAQIYGANIEIKSTTNLPPTFIVATPTQ